MPLQLSVMEVLCARADCDSAPHMTTPGGSSVAPSLSYVTCTRGIGYPLVNSTKPHDQMVSKL